MHVEIQVHFLLAHHLDVGGNHVKVVELHDFTEATFQSRLTVGIARIQANLATDHLFVGLGVTADIDLVDRRRQALAHAVRKVHHGIVYKGPFFVELGKQVAVFAIGVQNGLAGGVVLVLVKDFAAIQAEGVVQNAIVQHLVARKMDIAHVVLAALYHGDVDADSAGGMDVVVLVQGREHVLYHVADQQLFFVGRTLLLIPEGINFRIVELAALHDFQPFLAGLFVADDVVQKLQGVFFGLDLG